MHASKKNMRNDFYFILVDTFSNDVTQIRLRRVFLQYYRLLIGLNRYIAHLFKPVNLPLNYQIMKTPLYIHFFKMKYERCFISLCRWSQTLSIILGGFTYTAIAHQCKMMVVFFFIAHIVFFILICCYPIGLSLARRRHVRTIPKRISVMFKDAFVFLQMY